MKEIKKKSDVLLADALARLDRAVMRLTQAGSDVTELRSLGAVHDALKAKLADSERQHAILREAANRVASRLDHQIERLASMVEGK